jgi:sulfur carrier protein
LPDFFRSLFIRTANGLRPGIDFQLETSHSKLETVSMHLFINGDEKSFADSLSLAQLIEQLGMKGDRVAVELNREIVSRAQWAETNLNDGDRLEIVHFVGGG